MHSAPGFRRSRGNISSPSPSESHVNHITLFRPSGRWGSSSDGTLRALSSSGQSYTIHELCTCTGFSKPLEGQMSFWQASSGDSYSNALEDPKCVRCNLVRPYRLTSVSM